MAREPGLAAAALEVRGAAWRKRLWESVNVDTARL